MRMSLATQNSDYSRELTDCNLLVLLVRLKLGSTVRRWAMHQYTTDMYEGMLAETIMLPGHNGEIINAYYARPLGPGPFPGVVLIHHMPGWDELYREFTRKFAYHGYLAISPNIYFRFGHGSPDDMSAKVRGSGGVPDVSVVGDIDSSARYLKSLPLRIGKVGFSGPVTG